MSRVDPGASSAASLPDGGAGAWVADDTEVVGRRHRIGGGLLLTAGGYLLGVAMMGLVFASGPPGQLLDAQGEPWTVGALYQWGFVGASLLAPAFVSLLLLLAAAAEVPVHAARRLVATALLGAYVPLATFAYTSQYTFFPRLVERDPDAAVLWYFHDVDSLPYAVDLAGYSLLGLAAIVLASALLARGRRALAGWLALMGSLSIAAFALHAAGADAVAGLLSIASAVCTVPVVVLAVREGRRLRARPR